jgi:uncharacterized membrane-anchored protein
MNHSKALVQAAQAEGLLPAAATEVLNDPAPSWVVTALSFVGAQFAVWPFLSVLGLLGFKVFFEPPISYVMAALLIGGAVLGMRAKLNLFVTHLCLTALLVGLGLLVFSLESQLGWKSFNTVFILLLVVLTGVALLVRVGWVQRLLGFLAALTLMLIVFGTAGEHDQLQRWWTFPPLANSLLLAIAWAALCAFEIPLSTSKLARNTAAFADGVGVALLCVVLFSSGAAFVGQGVFSSGMRAGSADSATAGLAPLFAFHWRVGLQIGVTLLAWFWIAKRFDLFALTQRRSLAALTVVYLCLAVFSFFTHDGGVVAIVGTVALATGRKRLLALAALVLLAQLSGFYYALAWPLVEKARLLALTGAFLGVFLWALRKQFAAPRNATENTSSPATRSRFAVPLIAAGAVLALGGANYDVMKKEQVIEGGKKIYLSLAPRDPRSLMQGDYMALNFGFPREVQTVLDAADESRSQTRATVVAKLDERGVATVLRVAAPAEALAASEMLLPLKRVHHNWVLVTDAFYFPEGAGSSLQQARFGEFRALPDGRALLVGLADEQLKPLSPAKKNQAQ